MAESSYPCRIDQAFNFEKDQQKLVGHLVSIKIGTVQLAADIELTTPLDSAAASAKVKVVGPISHIYWHGGYNEAIQINVNVGIANKTEVAVLTHTNLANTETLFKFKIYEFDPVAKKYFEAFHSGDVEMKGFIEKKGGDLDLRIATENDPTVESPLNFPLSISIMPQPIKQDLLLAFSDTRKLTKVWGTTGPAS
jgi:hypothetical protein